MLQKELKPIRYLKLLGRLVVPVYDVISEDAKVHRNLLHVLIESLTEKAEKEPQAFFLRGLFHHKHIEQAVADVNKIYEHTASENIKLGRLEQLWQSLGGELTPQYCIRKGFRLPFILFLNGGRSIDCDRLILCVLSTAFMQFSKVGRRGAAEELFKRLMEASCDSVLCSAIEEFLEGQHPSAAQAFCRLWFTELGWLYEDSMEKK